MFDSYSGFILAILNWDFVMFMLIGHIINDIMSIYITC